VHFLEVLCLDLLLSHKLALVPEPNEGQALLRLKLIRTSTPSRMGVNHLDDEFIENLFPHTVSFLHIQENDYENPKKTISALLILR
jgi:hypothetical protein